MNIELASIEDKYLSCLLDYLKGEEESALARAYELGRLANVRDVSILELLSAHQGALDRALQTIKTHSEILHITRIANRMLAESLASFEMTNRGFKKSLSELADINKALEREITERKAAEIQKQELLGRMQKMAEELEASNEELRATTAELQAANAALRQQTKELSNLNLELKESQERFSSAFHSSPSPLSISRLDDGMFIDVNESYLRLFGYEKKDLIGRYPVALYRDPNDRVKMVHQLHEKGEVRNFETVARRRNGKELNVLMSAVVSGLNEQKFILWTCLDVSERKRAEEGLKRANEKLEARVRQRTAEIESERRRLFNVLETVPIMVCLLTPDHHVPFANRAFREKFGESQDRYCYEYCFGKSQPCEFCQSYKVLETGQPHHWEVVTPDSKSVIDAYDFPFIDTDGQKMILEMDIDITAQKIAEAELKDLNETLEKRVAERTIELENSNRELESFSYSVSHDLRAPLRTLDGFSGMMLEDYGDKLDETGKDYLERVRKASHTMSELIDALLKLSRISRVEMHQDQVDLSDLARSISEGLKFSQPERQAEFIIEPNLIVQGDLELLRVALNNLLENAWKYTGKCTQTRIELGKTDQKGEKVYFIKDNGIGFDMKYKDKLFQPFQRLHAGNEYPGTGIGLATVQRVIRRHNGRIWAESEIGKGTTFYFTLE